MWARSARGQSLSPAVGGSGSADCASGRHQVGEDTVHGVIHRFNEIGLACLDLSEREAVPVC